MTFKDQRPDVRPEASLELPLFPNDDVREQGVTCIFCTKRTPCEYVISIRRDGETSLVGIHSTCVASLRKRNPTGPTEEKPYGCVACGVGLVSHGMCPQCSSAWKIGYTDGLNADREAAMMMRQRAENPHTAMEAIRRIRSVMDHAALKDRQQLSQAIMTVLDSTDTATSERSPKLYQRKCKLCGGVDGLPSGNDCYGGGLHQWDFEARP